MKIDTKEKYHKATQRNQQRTTTISCPLGRNKKRRGKKGGLKK